MSVKEPGYQEDNPAFFIPEYAGKAASGKFSVWIMALKDVKIFQS